MKKMFVLSAVLKLTLVFVILLIGCNNNPSNEGVITPYPHTHVPEITQFVLGMTLADTEFDFGLIHAKTVFNRGDLLSYGFRAQDTLGDWKQMVHIVKYTDQTPDYSWHITNYFPDDQTTDLSWDFSSEFIDIDRIAIDKSTFILEKSGTYKMTWYIVDKAGNVSNSTIATITVN